MQTELDVSRNLSKLRVGQTVALLNKFYIVLLKKVIEPVLNKKTRLKMKVLSS